MTEATRLVHCMVGRFQQLAEPFTCFVYKQRGKQSWENRNERG